MNMIRISKWVSVLAGLWAVLFVFAPAASAHVTVAPAEVPSGSYQVFTVRVPSETKGTSTVAVRVAVPEGVSISRTEPKPGWKTDLETREDGSLAAVTWTAADGKGLSETEFTEFRMQGKVANDADRLVWKAYQTYADGSKAEWIGADENAEYPASVTTVTAGAAGDDGHGHGAAPAADAEDGGEAADGTGGYGLALGLSIAGCVLGLAALVAAVAGRRRKA